MTELLPLPRCLRLSPRLPAFVPLPLLLVFGFWLGILMAPTAALAQDGLPEVPAAVSAEASEASGNALIEKLRGSGKTGVALFLISVVGFSFAFERCFHLRKSLITPDGMAARADTLWRSGD